MTNPRVPRWFATPRYPLYLLIAFGVWFALWAYKPPHPKDFVLEHALTAAFIAILVWNHRHFRLSNLSYTCIFVFMCLHVVGAHYTYAEVPYESWLASLGQTLHVTLSPRVLFGWERNQYDRLVHFSFGLLMAYPVREIFVRVARVRGFWTYYLPLDVMMSFSMLYELLEWLIAETMSDVGPSYLGTQGDVWDAQKDMAMASLGALLAMLAVALVNWWLDRDFATELAQSLRADDSGPAGENRLEALLGRRGAPKPADQ